ncbi:MAG: hypothetical protein ACW97Z_12150 [Candidatus Hodarchaeales archaeon]
MLGSVEEKSTGTDNNSIMWNRFIENGLGDTTIQQAKDNGINNEIVHNYWSDWITPDRNGDGIVDLPYLIDGDVDVKNTDKYPHVYPTFETYPPDPFYRLPDLIIRGGLLFVLVFLLVKSYGRRRKEK